MERNKSTILTINSTDDARRADPNGSLRDHFRGIDPNMFTMRYEPNTNFLFVDAQWLSMERFDVYDEEKGEFKKMSDSLFKNTQYIGPSSIRMLKGTGHNQPPRRVHVFDLNKVSAIRSVASKKREAYRRSQLRKNKGDVKLTAAAMKAYDDIQWGIDIGKEGQIDELKRQLKKAEEVAKVLLRQAQGLKPIRRKNVIKEKLEAVDTCMKEFKNDISIIKDCTEYTYRIPKEVKEEYYAPAPTVLGLYKETSNRNGTNHKKLLYLHVAQLKDSIPNYRRDIRYTHSQSTYIKTVDAEGNVKAQTLYCAVFDLLRR